MNNKIRYLSIIVALLASKNALAVNNSVEEILKCSNQKIQIDSLDKTNSEQLICYFLDAKKNIETLISEKVICKDIGLESYGIMMNYAPVFNMSLNKIEDVGYGLAYRLQVNSINNDVLNTYSMTTAILANGSVQYNSNGKKISFSDVYTIIGTAKPPESKSNDLCIWLD